jgi:adenylate cyclase
VRTGGRDAAMDDAEFVTMGLLDPDLPTADDRRELLVWLVEECGFSLGELVEARRAGISLIALPSQRLLREPPTLTAEEVRERLGITNEFMTSLARAFGYPLEAGPCLTEGDVETFRVATDTAEMMTSAGGDVAPIIEHARVMRDAAVRVATSGNSFIAAHLLNRLKDQGASSRELAETAWETMRIYQRFPLALDALLRLEGDAFVSADRLRSASGRQVGVDVVRVVIGFFDVSGYTALSRGLEPADLARLVDDFETRVHDVVGRHGGRVVKLIGDAVMFTVTQPSAGVDIARGLLGAYASDAMLAPHGGLAHGDAIARVGDYFGPTVNLAARLAETSVPGEVLVTTGVAAQVEGLEPAGRRMLKGFDEPVELYALT